MDKNQSQTACTISCRSRYERFKASATSKRRTRRRARSREPSRIPRKKLARVLGKSRQFRRLARNSILRNFPKSSNIHKYTTVVAFQRASMYGYFICSGGKKNTFKTKLNLRNYCDGTSQRKPSNRNRRKLQKICVTSTINDTTNQRPDVFKSLTQRTNYSKFLLSRDVEQNPVPTIVDPTKTIAAPYSQGNIAVFGTTNAGRQCVAMSLSALVFNFRKAITSSADLIQVMNIGNCLYSTLLQSTKEMFLLLTDLPAMVSLFEASYDLRFSESYSGFLSGDSYHVTDFPYVMSLAAAFDSLLRENYSSCILTIGSYAVAIYSLANGRYKIFDSHSKDLSGLTHPLGTCTLIETDSLDNVVQYLHTFHA